MTIYQPSQLKFSRIHNVFDNINPSHLFLLQHLMKFERLNGKSLVSFHRQSRMCYNVLVFKIMSLCSNKQSHSASPFLKWQTKCHLRSADRSQTKIQRCISQSKNSAALDMNQCGLFCLSNLLIHHKVTFVLHFPLQNALLPGRLPEILE